jgi:hypothetical protein
MCVLFFKFCLITFFFFFFAYLFHNNTLPLLSLLLLTSFVKFPAPFSNMLGFLSVVSFEFISWDCLGSEDPQARYFNTLLLWSLLPLSFCISNAILGYIRIKCMQLDETEVAVVKGQHAWFFFFLLHITLPMIVFKQLEFFDCIILESGESYIRSDTSISCTSSEYLSYRPPMVFFLVIYLCVPILWMIILFRNREGLNPPTNSTDKNLPLYIRDHNLELVPLKFLFKDYDCNKWWFEVAEMYRRLLFVAVLPYVSTKSTTKASVGCVLAIVSGVYFREAAPFRIEFTNLLAYVSQVIYSAHVWCVGGGVGIIYTVCFVS